MSSRVGEVWEATVGRSMLMLILVVGDAIPERRGLLGLDLMSGQVNEYSPDILSEWENPGSRSKVTRIA